MIHASESGAQCSRQQTEKRWFSAPSVKTEVECFDSGASDELPSMNEPAIVTLMPAETAIDLNALNHECPATGNQTRPSVASQSQEISAAIDAPTIRPGSGRHYVLPPIHASHKDGQHP